MIGVHKKMSVKVIEVESIRIGFNNKIEYFFIICQLGKWIYI
jgi:hypothetical protein